MRLLPNSDSLDCPSLEIAVTFKVTTLPQQKLHFTMIRSNCLKAFSGSWLLTPLTDKETKVEMHTFVETNLPIPQILVNQFVAGKMRKRLQKIKKLAESAAKEPAKSKPSPKT